MTPRVPSMPPVTFRPVTSLLPLASSLFAGVALLTSGCVKVNESARIASASPTPAPVATPTKPPLAPVTSGHVSAREILKRALAAAKASGVDLDALAAKPSSAALGKACAGLGELEAYLVSLSLLLSDKLLDFQASASAPLPSLLQDPRRWISTASRLAPLCSRPGSSSDDFAADISDAKANVAAALATLGGLSALQNDGSKP